MTNLQQRILVAAIYFPLLLLSVFSKTYFAMVLSLLCIVAWWEFQKLFVPAEAPQPKNPVVAWLFVAAMSLPVLFPAFGGSMLMGWAVLALAFQIIVSVQMSQKALWVDFSKRFGPVLLGVFYITGLFSLLYVVRDRSGGEAAIWFIFVVVGVSDSVAYFVGRKWGTKPFFPHVSPKKTIQGFWGGLAAGTLVAVAYGWALAARDYKVPDLAMIAALGLVVSLVGIFGDLFESFLKRSCGVKDSGKALGGHGGVLDRFDAVLFASVPVLIYILWRDGFV
jgi:phosphatidate cytidylyltransferase